jgi:hypothetical protein
MQHYKQLTDFAEAIDIKMAVVQVKPGESNRDAWSRHLRDNPHDAGAMIKVFNQPQVKEAGQSRRKESVRAGKESLNNVRP